PNGDIVVEGVPFIPWWYWAIELPTFSNIPSFDLGDVAHAIDQVSESKLPQSGKGRQGRPSWCGGWHEFGSALSDIGEIVEDGSLVGTIISEGATSPLAAVGGYAQVVGAGLKSYGGDPNAYKELGAALIPGA